MTYDLNISFDGACNVSNPTDKIGYACSINGKEHLGSLVRKDGTLTNNVSEYYGFGLALKQIRDHFKDPQRILIQGDSNMVVQQMNGNWRIKKGVYREAALICKKLLAELRKIHTIIIEWVPREQNTHADDLSKKALKL